MWKEILKNNAGRKNKDDFKEYGEKTPMPKSAKEERDEILAPKKPLTEDEKLHRKQRKISRRKKFEEKKTKRKTDAEREAKRRAKPKGKDYQTMIDEADKKERKELEDGPKNIFPKGE